MAGEELRKTLKDAREALRTRQFAQARSLLDEVLQSRPDSAAALRIKHDLHYAMEDFDSALATAMLLVDLSPEASQGHVAAARTLMELRRIKEARTHLDRARALEPTNLNVLRLSNDFYRDQGHRDTALETSRLIVEHHPDKPDGYSRVIHDLVAMNEIDEAQSCLDKLRATHPDHPRTLRATILLRRAQGDHHAALASAQRQIERKPGDFNAQVRAMQACLALQDFEQAKTFLQGARGASEEMADNSMRCVEAAIRLYGVEESAAHLRSRPHNTEGTAEKGQKKYIFVSGLARSGTSALGDLFNLSDEIAVYFEILSPTIPYSPGSFDPAFLEGILTTDRHRSRRNGELFVKAKKAAYVGDKRPKFFLRLEQSLEFYKGESIHVFHLVRPLRDVCLSYQARADNPNDASWSTLHGSAQAIIDYEMMCDVFLAHAAKKVDAAHKIVFVPYQKAFTDKDYAYSLFDDLELSDRADLSGKVEAFVQKSRAIATKERVLDSETEEQIRKGLNIDKVRAFESLSGCPCL